MSLLKVPMSMSDRANDDNAASVESGVSLAEMVTVTEPMGCPTWLADTITVSASSSAVSSVAVTVAVAEPAPAVRVTDVAGRSWSEPEAVPAAVRPMLWSASKALPLVMATVTAALPPSVICDRSVDTDQAGASLSGMVTVVKLRDRPQWVAEMVTVSSPSARSSSVAAKVTVAEVSPAGRVRVAGRV